VFLINLPIGLVALAIVLRFLHIPHTRRSVRIDWWGATTVIIGLVPLLLVAENGREWGWASPAAFACYGVGALGIVAFILIERVMGDDALIPLRLFKHPTFSMATVLGVLVGFGMFGAMMTIPLYLQLVSGATPTESGFLMLPMILGLMIASIGSGQLIARTGRYRMFPILGTGLMATGFFWLTFLSVDKPVWYLMIGMFLIGLGLGQLMQTLTIAAQNSVGPRDIGVATSASTFFRQIGGTLGTAVLFSVLFTRIPETIAAAFSRSTVKDGIAEAVADPTVLADPQNKQILELLQQGQNGGAIGNALDGDTSFLNGSDPRLAAPFLQGFNDATVTVYWVALAVVLVAFVLSFFLKAAPLRAKSALQENADAALAAQEAAAESGALVAPDVALNDPAAGDADDATAPSARRSPRTRPTPN
jgi:hypothetical protein